MARDGGLDPERNGVLMMGLKVGLEDGTWGVSFWLRSTIPLGVDDAMSKKDQQDQIFQEFFCSRKWSVELNGLSLREGLKVK